MSFKTYLKKHKSHPTFDEYPSVLNTVQIYFQCVVPSVLYSIVHKKIRACVLKMVALQSLKKYLCNLGKPALT